MVLIHSAVLKDDSKDLPYTRYTALAAVGGTDGEISVHRGPDRVNSDRRHSSETAT